MNAIPELSLASRVIQDVVLIIRARIAKLFDFDPRLVVSVLLFFDRDDSLLRRIQRQHRILGKLEALIGASISRPDEFISLRDGIG